MSSQPSDGLTTAAHWERSLVAADGGETALAVRIAVDHLQESDRRRAPLDVAFVLDRSGSMRSEKLRLVKEAVDVAAGQLRDQDRVALVVFDDTIETLQPLRPATVRTKTALRLALQGVDAGGTTDLCGGWLAGCHELASTPESGDQTDAAAARPRRALLLTDGQATVGVTNPGQLMGHATELRKRGISTTALGVGLDFDEVLLGGMAEAGGGNFQYISQPAELPAFFAREIGELLTVVGIAPRLELTLPSGVRAELVNAFPARRAGKTITVDLRDVAAGDELALIFDCHAAGDPGVVKQATARLSWANPISGDREQIERVLPPLTLVSRADAATAPVNDEVREQAALERAARDRREAIHLDRAGHYAESRARFRHAAHNLQAAPQSAAVREAFQMSAMLADADGSTALAEPVRKQRFAEDHRRSRGHRT